MCCCRSYSYNLSCCISSSCCSIFCLINQFKSCLVDIKFCFKSCSCWECLVECECDSVSSFNAWNCVIVTSVDRFNFSNEVRINDYISFSNQVVSDHSLQISIKRITISTCTCIKFICINRINLTSNYDTFFICKVSKACINCIVLNKDIF